MTASPSPHLQGLVPYLHYDDAGAAIDWLARVFGFVEKARWLDANGRVTNAEMLVGNQELWLDGSGDGWWAKKGRGPEQWIGVWVDDVDAMYERVRAAGVDVGRGQVGAGLARLDPDLRTAIVLRFFVDLSVRDIAELLGVPEGTVKSRLHRAVTVMRELLPKESVT